MTGTPPRQVVYLHGFASSSASSKAQFFRDRLTAVGVVVHVPDLNLPDFETMTVSRMIGQVRDLVTTMTEGPVALMGSSMGAFVAWHAAAVLARDPVTPVPSHLVLLAPAVTFGRDRDADFGAGVVDAWERDGTREFFHYGYEAPRLLRYDFYRDAMAHQQSGADPGVPTLVFQGTQDEVVSPEGVQAFFAGRPHATVRLLDDGHQLQAHLETMWEETRAFLGV